MSHSNKKWQHLLELNLAILCISTSGALGRYIDLPVPVTTGLRAVIACGLIFLFCKWKGFNLKINPKDLPVILLSGIFMGIHWITYFYALQYSNVAVGMLSLFTYPVLTSILEPVLLKTKFQRIHLLLGAMVLLGTLLLVPDFDLQHDYFLAIVLGITSALAYSLRNLITKSKVETYNGSVLMLYQLAIVSVVLLPSYFLSDLSQLPEQIYWVMLLALVTTAIGHTWFIYSFRNFSVTSASFISSLQPVYGILIGMFFLNEIPHFLTLIGGILIITSVFIESLITYQKSNVIK